MNNYNRLLSKKEIIYDFDLTIARLDIDWSGWHDGAEVIFQKYDSSFIRKGPINHFTNLMVSKYGQNFRNDIDTYNRQYEYDNFHGAKLNTKLIDFIKSNNKISHHIFTSQHHLLLNKVMLELGIDELFDKIVTRDDVTYIKPESEGLNLIMKGKNPSNFIFAGDAITDEQAAITQGIDFEYVSME